MSNDNSSNKNLHAEFANKLGHFSKFVILVGFILSLLGGAFTFVDAEYNYLFVDYGKISLVAGFFWLFVSFGLKYLLGKNE